MQSYKTLLISSDLSADNRVSESLQKSIQGKIGFYVGIRLLLEDGKVGSLIAVMREPRTSISALEISIVSEIAGAIEDLYASRRNHDWLTAKSNLSLCSGLMTGLHMSLYDMNEIKDELESQWDTVGEYLERIESSPANESTEESVKRARYPLRRPLFLSNPYYKRNSSRSTTVSSFHPPSRNIPNSLSKSLDAGALSSTSTVPFDENAPYQGVPSSIRAHIAFHDGHKINSIDESGEVNGQAIDPVVITRESIRFNQKTPTYMLLILSLDKFLETLRHFMESSHELNNAVERTIHVATGYIATDRSKYINSCTEIVNYGFVAKLNQHFSVLSEKLPRNNTLIWSFNQVNSVLGNCAHQTFYHHLIVFLENILYLWSKACSVPQLIIEYEPVEWSATTDYDDYVGVVDGYIKVLINFPEVKATTQGGTDSDRNISPNTSLKQQFNKPTGSSNKASSAGANKGLTTITVTSSKGELHNHSTSPPSKGKGDGSGSNSQASSTASSPKSFQGNKSELNDFNLSKLSKSHSSQIELNKMFQSKGLERVVSHDEETTIEVGSSSNSVRHNSSIHNSSHSNKSFVDFSVNSHPPSLPKFTPSALDDLNEPHSLKLLHQNNKPSSPKSISVASNGHNSAHKRVEHPMRYIGPLLSLMNSSLCKLSTCSLVSTIAVPSESNSFDASEGYYIRLPCRVFLTVEQEQDYFQFNKGNINISHPTKNRKIIPTNIFNSKKRVMPLASGFNTMTEQHPKRMTPNSSSSSLTSQSVNEASLMSGTSQMDGTLSSIKMPPKEINNSFFHKMASRVHDFTRGMIFSRSQSIDKSSNAFHARNSLPFHIPSLDEGDGFRDPEPVSHNSSKKKKKRRSSIDLSNANNAPSAAALSIRRRKQLLKEKQVSEEQKRKQRLNKLNSSTSSTSSSSSSPSRSVIPSSNLPSPINTSRRSASFFSALPSFLRRFPPSPKSVTHAPAIQVKIHTPIEEQQSSSQSDDSNIRIVAYNSPSFYHTSVSKSFPFKVSRDGIENV